MHYGTFLVKPVRMLLVNPLPDGTRFVDVVKTEEKGSDVNLATYLVADGYEGAYDAAVVVSDDSDLAEAVQIVRQRLRRHVTILSPRGRSQELRQVASRFRQIATCVHEVAYVEH